MQEEATLRMVVLAGPNGSGKSTIIDKAKFDDKFPGIYINADDIARSELAHIKDYTERNMQAAKIADQRRKNALEGGQIIATTKHHVLQQASPNFFVLHDRALYPLQLEKGQEAVVAYQYKGGKMDEQAIAKIQDRCTSKPSVKNPRSHSIS